MPHRTDSTPADRPDARVARSRRYGRLMDDVFTIPGTKIGFGLDSLIGLVPGIGDAAGTVLSTAILVEAVRARVSIPVLLRMGLNLLFDTIIGYIPLAGDVADVGFRANKKNARLLEEALTDGRTHTGSTGAYLMRAGLIIVVLLLIMIASVVLTVWLLLTLLNPYR
ncbi:MAG: DUF4112 domain-containing protein [Propionibacteriales bacterium]|nr:DUF4112 domain-containing protein [Propionibacteriales bacterium]